MQMTEEVQYMRAVGGGGKIYFWHCTVKGQLSIDKTKWEREKRRGLGKVHKPGLKFGTLGVKKSDI